MHVAPPAVVIIARRDPEEDALLRALPPPGGSLPLAETYKDPGWPLPEAARPYIVLNMVSTVDGKVAVGGGAAKVQPTRLLREAQQLEDVRKAEGIE